MLNKRLYPFGVLILVIACYAGAPLPSAESTDEYRHKRASRTKCPSGRYLDEVTGHCDPCAPHCDRSFENPPSGCQTICSQMKANVGTKKTTKFGNKCQVGFYYDSVTRNCDPCLPHCERGYSEEPPGDCKTFCNNVTTAIPGQAEPEKEEEGKLGLTSGELAAICLSVLIVLVAVISIFAVWLHKRRTKTTNNREVEQREPFRPSVREETSDAERTEMVVNPTTSAV